eukprot:scaffold36198_cov19-Tisochrysis_lutea.AAC.3
MDEESLRCLHTFPARLLRGNAQSELPPKVLHRPGCHQPREKPLPSCQVSSFIAPLPGANLLFVHDKPAAP